MLLGALTRDQVRDALLGAEFDPYLHPSTTALERVLQDIERNGWVSGFSAPEPDPCGDDLIADFVSAHGEFNRRLNPQLRDHVYTAEQLQAPSGPYRPLAEMLAQFLLDWHAADVFADETVFTGILFCEHVLAMHGFTATLAYPEAEPKGAIISWLSRRDNHPDHAQRLTSAILGRFRTQARPES